MASSNKNSANGMLIINKPVSGKWEIEVWYGENRSHANSAGATAIDVTMNIIGSDAGAVNIRALQPGRGSVDLRKLADQQGSGPEISNALNVE